MQPAFLHTFEDSNPAKKQVIERWLLDNVDDSQQRKQQVICFLNSTSFYLTSLPETRAWRPEVMARLLSLIVDHDMKEDLVKSGLINWCPNVRCLVPVQVPKDGNCLLHSVALAVWGITDRSLMLRRLLCLALGVDKGHRFQGRWLYQRQRQITQLVDKLLESGSELVDREWAEIRQCLEPDCPQSEAVLYRFLEPIHVYTLANILRRPIIVLTGSTICTLRGLSLQDNDMGGIYLPLEWNWSDTSRMPLLLSYSHSHFCPLLFTDHPNQSSKETKLRRDLAPLVNSRFEQFPVRFLLQGEEPQVGYLLRKYLRVRETVMQANETVQNILCAEVEVRGLPAELNLVTDFVQDCMQRFPQGTQVPSPQRLLYGPAAAPQAGRVVHQERRQVPPADQPQELPQNVRREQLLGAPAPQFALGDPTLHSAGGLGHQINIPPPSLTPVRHCAEQSASLNPSPDKKCMMPGCKFYGDPDLGMMCSRCFQNYTIKESRQMSAAGARPFPNAPLASIPAEEPRLQLSMMNEQCQENCGYRCSVTTFPYCHECAGRRQKQGQGGAVAAAAFGSALGASTGGQAPGQFSNSPGAHMPHESCLVAGNTPIGMMNAAQSNLMNAAQSNMMNTAQSNMMNAAQSNMMNAAQSNMMNAAQSNLMNTAQSSMMNTAQSNLMNAAQNSLNVAWNSSMMHTTQSKPSTSQTPVRAAPSCTADPSPPHSSPSVSQTQLLEDMTRALVTGDEPGPLPGPDDASALLLSSEQASAMTPSHPAQAGSTPAAEPHLPARELEAGVAGQDTVQMLPAASSSQQHQLSDPDPGQDLSSAASLAKSLARAPDLGGTEGDPQAACASQDCTEPAVHQTLCWKCYISQNMKSLGPACAPQQKRSSEMGSLTDKKMEMTSFPPTSSAPPSIGPASSASKSNATYTKEFGAFILAESRSQPGSLRDLRTIPPMNYTSSWIQENRFAEAPLMENALTWPGQKSPLQGLPDKLESETLGSNLIESGAGCFSSTQRCIGEGCGNAILQGGKLCQQCQDILRHARQGGEAAASGQAAQRDAEQQPCRREGCSFFGIQQNHGYCSRCYAKHADREAEERNSHGDPAGSVPRPSPLPQPSGTITVPPEFHYVHTPSQRQGQLCPSAGCRLFGDPEQAGMCFGHYQQHLVSIAKATSALPAFKRQRNATSIAYAPEVHITPNSVTVFTSGDVFPPQKVAVPPPSLPVEVGGLGRPQEPSLGEMYNRVTGRLVGKCLNPACFNYGNRNKRGLCNGCAHNQRVTDDLISRAIYGDEETG